MAAAAACEGIHRSLKPPRLVRHWVQAGRAPAGRQQHGQAQAGRWQDWAAGTMLTRQVLIMARTSKAQTTLTACVLQGLVATPSDEASLAVQVLGRRHGLVQVSAAVLTMMVVLESLLAVRSVEAKAACPAASESVLTLTEDSSAMAGMAARLLLEGLVVAAVACSTALELVSVRADRLAVAALTAEAARSLVEPSMEAEMVVSTALEAAWVLVEGSASMMAVAALWLAEGQVVTEVACSMVLEQVPVDGSTKVVLVPAEALATMTVVAAHWLVKTLVEAEVACLAARELVTASTVVTARLLAEHRTLPEVA